MAGGRANRFKLHDHETHSKDSKLRVLGPPTIPPPKHVESFLRHDHLFFLPPSLFRNVPLSHLHIRLGLLKTCRLLICLLRKQAQRPIRPRAHRRLEGFVVRRGRTPGDCFSF